MSIKLNYLGGTDWVNGDILEADDLIDTIKQSTLTSHPIGSVIGWDKSATGVPSLPGVWVECNGQTLNDPDSPRDGQVIPDLNGDNRFLRGNNTSGDVSSTGIHNHQYWEGGGSTGNRIRPTGQVKSGSGGVHSSYNSSGNEITFNSGGNASASNAVYISGDYYTKNATSIPKHMTVVWITRIK